MYTSDHVPVQLQRRQALALALGLAASPWAQAQPVATEDETWTDSRRRREIPVRIRWPLDTLPAPVAGHPVVLFSHGLGGTRDSGSVWGEAWVAAGCVVVHLQHPGSDLAAVRAVTDSFADRAGLRRAAGPQQLLARLQDVRFALDELARRQRAGVGRWDKARPDAVGMSGHSFGAHTTLGIAGQSYPGFAGITEPRLAAFIAFSPSLPIGGGAQQAFARITQPMLCLTGTRDDDVAGTGATPQQRMAVFDALPAGHKAQLILQDADHMTFGGQTGRAAEIIPREAVTRSLQPRHHALAAAITADWWRAELMNDAAAKARLARPQGLAAGDVWKTG
jgi:predicted dienelactone hydrolase